MTFLDIEETIIESVDCPTELIGQIEKIKSFVRSGDKIFIFSFAIWSEDDMTESLRKLIESHFGKFEIVFKNDLKPLFRNLFGIKDDLDFMDFSNNKETAFLLWVKENIINGNVKEDCLFFDDMISTMDIKINGVNVSFKNVKEM